MIMNIQGALQYSGLYLIIFFLSLLFNAFHTMDKRKKRNYLIISLTPLMLMSMFRAEHVGNDTWNYIELYKMVAANDFSYIQNSITEKGYLLYDYIIFRYFNHYQFIFIISSFFIYSSIYFFLMKYIQAPGAFMCIFIGMNMFDFFLSTQRQGIAIAILIYAIDAAFEKKLFKFLIFVAVAFLFHYSSIVFLFIYPLVNTRIQKQSIKVIVVAVTALLLLFFNRILSLLLIAFPKYRYYEGGALFDGEPRLAIVLKISVYMLLLIVTNMYVNMEDKNKQDCIQGSSQYKFFNTLALINICLFAVSSQATALARFCSLFNIYPISNYSNALGRVERKSRMILSILTGVAFYIYGLVIILLKTPTWITTYPFEFVKSLK